ncbi:MAG: hypoxanthine phosphoribosyltransferase [Candidatus Kapaibacterium sp.]
MRVHDKDFEPFIPQDAIQQAVRRIAEALERDYAGCESLVCMVVLKGSFIFAADLLRELTVPCRIEFISAKSYGSAMESSGKVAMQIPDIDLKGKHVLLIEDIVDTGLTLSSLLSAIQASGPASLEIAALISKPAMRKVELRVKYQGIEIPPVFILGYGLDYAEHGRALPDIWALAGGAEQ